MGTRLASKTALPASSTSYIYFLMELLKFESGTTPPKHILKYHIIKKTIYMYMKIKKQQGQDGFLSGKNCTQDHKGFHRVCGVRVGAAGTLACMCRGQRSMAVSASIVQLTTRSLQGYPSATCFTKHIRKLSSSFRTGLFFNFY